MRHRASRPAQASPAPRPAPVQGAPRRGRRRAQPDAEQRRARLLASLAPVSAVLIVAAVLVAVYADHHTGSSPPPAPVTTAAPARLVAHLATVPAATFNQVGRGSIVVRPKALSSAPLTAGGLPAVLFVGAEYCPYCAAERWPLIVALSRFGTFHGLGTTASSPTEAYPKTATLSFHGATYTSSVLSFTGKELYSNQPSAGSYAPLDTLEGSEATLFDGLGQGSTPFLDLGGTYVVTGASFDPQVLHGLSAEQIADSLADPDSAVAKAVDGTANVMTAALCQLTAGQPAGVCDTAGVAAGTTELDG